MLKFCAGVDRSHPSVDGHVNHITMKEIEEKKGKKEERERQEEQMAREKGRELQITLLWKPHMSNVAFFRAAGKEWVWARLNPNDIAEYSVGNPQPRRFLHSGGD